MSADSERVYTIPLGKVLLSPNNRRAMRAINMIREFARRHMKVEDIRIDENLSHQIWSRGIKKPPRKIRVRMSRTDTGHILVSPYTLGSEPVADAPPDAPADDADETLKDAYTEDVPDYAELVDEKSGDSADSPDAPADTATSDPEPAPKTAEPAPEAAEPATSDPEPAPKTAEPAKDAPKTEQETPKADSKAQEKKD